MPPTIETMMQTETVYMDVTLKPTKSLSESGFKKVMLVMTLMSALTIAFFLPLGYYIIIGFVLVNLGVFWLLFHHSNKALSQRTHIRVTAEHLRVLHIDRRGQRSQIELPTSFTYVEICRPQNQPHFVKLSSAGKAYAIGKFLTDDEQSSFVDYLHEALIKARSERYA